MMTFRSILESRDDKEMRVEFDNLVKQGYSKPTEKQIKAMLKEISDYDPGHNNTAAAKYAMDDQGLKPDTSKVITKKLKVVASDKFSIPSALADAKKMAKKFDVTVTSNSNGLVLKGKTDSIKTLVDLLDY